MTRVLLLAHGDGRRWDTPDGPFLGHPKHFITVDGETLLHRAARLMLDRGCRVIVVGPDDRYRIDGCGLENLDSINGCGSDMGKFLDTRHLWAVDDRTVLMWGDCWYSEHCADLIAGHPSDDYTVFRRPGPSKLTGHRWDESFAVSFGPHEHDRIVDRARFLADLVVNRRLRATHIRTHLAAMAGIIDPRTLNDTRNTAKLPGQVHVDDWTDDFDTPDEWINWVAAYRSWHRDIDVAICVPWIDGDFWRAKARDATSRHWDRTGCPVFYGIVEPEKHGINRSAARNNAVALAGKRDVYFHADADTFVPHEQFWAAVHLARETGKLVRAFTSYHRLSQAQTRRCKFNCGLVPRYAAMGTSTWSNHASGAIAVPAELWEQVGGYDERFVAWGFEDRSFWLACRTLGDGEAPRIPGPAWHLWHPPSPDKDRRSDQYGRNQQLSQRYRYAARWWPAAGAMKPLVPPPDFPADSPPDPVAMRAVLTEPGGPLDPARREEVTGCSSHSSSITTASSRS